MAENAFEMGRREMSTGRDVDDEDEVAAELSGGRCHDVGEQAVAGAPRVSCRVVNDDYHWWKNRQYLPAAGKPLHVTLADEAAHPIFFDDNIHPRADDSIVCALAAPLP